MDDWFAIKYTKSNQIRFKLLIFSLAVLLSILVPASAAAVIDVNLEWDPSPGADGYKVFSREEGQPYDYGVPDWEGSETTCTIFNLNDNTTYHFVARAYNGQGDSGDSNEATYSPPTISLTPAVLSPSVTVGNNALSESFQVWNAGNGTLTYSITDNVNWFSLNPTSGTSTGEQDTITVTYNTSGLSAGSYSASITVSDPNAVNSPQTISVSLTVNAAPPQPPGIGLSTGSLSPSTTEGFNASSQTFKVWNSGEGTLSYNIGDNAFWLSLNPAPTLPLSP
jgi:hypothetical protein